MSLFPKEAVRVAADAGGYPGVSEEVAQQVASQLEYTLRELVQESGKFLRKAKRRRLTTDDLNHALRVRNMEPLYGYGHNGHVRSVERLFRRAKGSDVFYMPDDVVQLADVIAAPLPRIPADMRMTQHWLAIDGVQPNTPQNPGSIEATAAASAAASALAAGRTTAAVARPQTQRMAITNLRGDQAVTENPIAAPPILPLPAKQAKTVAQAQLQAVASAAEEITTQDGVQVKGLVKHVLSREQQLLFKQITEALVGDSAELRQSALESLAQDPGQHQLVPFFVEFATNQVTHNLKNLKILTGMVAMMRALFSNPNVLLELYLHQLMPPLLTCIVGKRLGQEAGEDHWALRREAAKVVVEICRRYIGRYQDLQSRVIKTMISSLLDKAKPLATHYGAAVCIGAFGPRVVDLFLVHNINQYQRIWESKRHTDPPAAERVRDALLDNVMQALKMRQADSVTVNPELPNFAEAERKRYQDVTEFFGEKLVRCFE